MEIIQINSHSLKLKDIAPTGGALVEIKWTEGEEISSNTDLTNLPVNPLPYDAPLAHSLPFEHDNCILLAKIETLYGRRFLWICLTTKKLFWLIGSVPNFICTWRESMLRRCKFELFAKKNKNIEDVVIGTVLFCSAKPFYSDSVTMQDILDQKTRVGGKNHDSKCALKVDQSEKIPQLKGLKRTACDVRLLNSHQIVNADSEPLLHVMGAGKLANIPVLPKQVSVSQISLALSALDQTVQLNPHNGPAELVEAMMDVDCAVFVMSVTMNQAQSVAEIIQKLRSVIPPLEQASLTMLIPSGVWQRSQSTGPTVRPINGGHWWQLPSPKYTREPLKVWVHAKIFWT